MRNYRSLFSHKYVRATFLFLVVFLRFFYICSQALFTSRVSSWWDVAFPHLWWILFQAGVAGRVKHLNGGVGILHRLFSSRFGADRAQGDRTIEEMELPGNHLDALYFWAEGAAANCQWHCVLLFGTHVEPQPCWLWKWTITLHSHKSDVV